jgi:hypothetical protein
MDCLQKEQMKERLIETVTALGASVVHTRASRKADKHQRIRIYSSRIFGPSQKSSFAEWSPDRPDEVRLYHTETKPGCTRTEQEVLDGIVPLLPTPKEHRWTRKGSTYTLDGHPEFMIHSAGCRFVLTSTANAVKGPLLKGTLKQCKLYAEELAETVDVLPEEECNHEDPDHTGSCIKCQADLDPRKETRQIREVVEKVTIGTETDLKLGVDVPIPELMMISGKVVAPTKKGFVGMVQVTSSGYDPNGPRVKDPTLEPGWEDMKKRILRAMFATWNAIAYDTLQMEDGKDVKGDLVQEMVSDADRMLMYGKDKEAVSLFYDTLDETTQDALLEEAFPSKRLFGM